MKPTASEPPPAPGDAQWLVHCSPERTLVARRRGADVVLVKIFESGSLLDAQQEAETARNLAHPGVVPYLGADKDPVTGKPCVTMEYCEGQNLERLIADQGPLPAGRAAGLAGQLASILAELHAEPRPGAPHGVVHRDIKPANVQAAPDGDGGTRIIVIDLEHVTERRAPEADRDAPSSPGFTGGTHGYAPPESYLGAYPSPGFDVFGLGATLFYLLTGCSAFPQRATEATIRRVREGTARLHLLRGQPRALRELVAACLDRSPDARPTAALVASRLATFFGTEIDADHDRALQAIQRADFDAAIEFLAAAEAHADHDRERESDLEDLAVARQRLLERIGGAPRIETPTLSEEDEDADQDLAAAAQAITDGIDRLTAFLIRFPHHATSLETRREMARTGHVLLERVPPCVARMKLTAQFTQARELLGRAAEVAGAIHRVPGGLSIDTTDAGYLPGPLLRNPQQLLARFLKDVENTEQIHEEMTARLETAEAELDLAGAGVAVDEITAIYGGASNVVAPLKDRLLRLEFYMQRIAWPQRQIGQLTDLLKLANEPHGLAKVTAFSEACSERVISETSPTRGKGGVRSLLETMHQLLEDFPHTQPAVAPAEAALADAMASVTRQAWTRLDEARGKLDAVPIPIRPVQKLLNRLDAIRMLEAFVDLPDRSRERLQDEVERVRMRLDQARTTRDNIARGAEEAMERGHLTTALFDMARAVDNFEDEGETEGAETRPQLAEKLEEAKRRKEELERGVVENHRLAARYAELIEDDQSSMAKRLEVLEARAAVLGRLILTLGPDKGSHYVTDLREVMLHLVQEKADQGERQLDRATDPETRLEIAQQTLRRLRETTASATGNRAAVTAHETGGRIRRVLDHWQFKERELHDQVSRDRQAAVDAQKRRRRSTVLSVIALVVVSVAAFGTWQVVQAWGREAPSVPFTQPTFRIERGSSGLVYPNVKAYSAISSFVERLSYAKTDENKVIQDLGIRAQCTAILDHLHKLVEGDLVPDDAWAQGFKDELTALDHALALLNERAGNDASWRKFFNSVQSFGRSAHMVGLSLAVVKRTDPLFLEAMVADLATLRHLALGAPELAHLRKTTRGQ